MGSRDLTAGVETPEEVFDTAVEISEDILDKMVANIKLAPLILVIAVSYSSGSPAHHRLRRAPQEQATRLFTGNSAIDAGAAGAALGGRSLILVGVVPGELTPTPTLALSMGRHYRMELLAFWLGLQVQVWSAMPLETLVESN